ncbi:MAG TPA: sulfatase-like hydrolase/transferase [Petrimonas sp.]|nr:sulfatase-like hydrolase/transferase [Petrimonas sp.]
MRNHIFNSLLTVATITYSGNLAAQQKPNVIFIYADDLGKGLLSAYGQKQYTTPNIDKLVKQGISFNRAYGCMLSGDIFNGNASMAGLKRSNLQGGVNVPRIFYWKGTFAENILLPDNRYVVYSSNLGAAIVENTGWKLRHYAKKNIFELYNLNTDPQERNNLIDNYPQIAEKLINILIRECESDLRNGINKTG